MMDYETMQAFTNVMARLANYGFARDRATEREPRTITITDDEALAIIEIFDTVSPGGMFGNVSPE